MHEQVPAEVDVGHFGILPDGIFSSIHPGTSRAVAVVNGDAAAEAMNGAAGDNGGCGGDAIACEAEYLEASAPIGTYWNRRLALKVVHRDCSYCDLN